MLLTKREPEQRKAEMLLEFLSPRDQMSFSKQISNVLEAEFEHFSV